MDWRARTGACEELQMQQSVSHTALNLHLPIDRQVMAGSGLSMLTGMVIKASLTCQSVRWRASCAARSSSARAVPSDF